MDVIEPPVLDKEKQADLMKRAYWNVRVAPFGFIVITAIVLYCGLTPHPVLTLPVTLFLNVLVFGMLVWLKHFYLDEKYLLETGKQRLSVGFTVGLIYYDKKPQPINWYVLFFLSINVITGTTKHTAAYKKRRRHLER